MPWYSFKVSLPTSQVEESDPLTSISKTGSGSKEGFRIVHKILYVVGITILGSISYTLLSLPKASFQDWVSAKFIGILASTLTYSLIVDFTKYLWERPDHS